MKTSIFCLVCALMAGLSFAASAADQPAGSTQASMAMPKPGSEAMALEPFFGRSVTWTGSCPAGSMGPDSKEIPTHGKAICHSLFGGFSFALDVEDFYGAGKEAMNWKGRMLVGYDSGTKTYRSFSADNTGNLVAWNGTLDGDKFVLESAAPFPMMGQMMDDRLTWVRNPDGTLAFTDEHRPQGGDWTLGEKATMRPQGGAKGVAEHIHAAMHGKKH